MNTPVCNTIGISLYIQRWNHAALRVEVASRLTGNHHMRKISWRKCWFLFCLPDFASLTNDSKRSVAETQRITFNGHHRHLWQHRPHFSQRQQLHTHVSKRITCWRLHSHPPDFTASASPLYRDSAYVGQTACVPSFIARGMLPSTNSYARACRMMRMYADAGWRCITTRAPIQQLSNCCMQDGRR